MNKRALLLCVGMPLSMAAAQVEVKTDIHGYKAIAVCDNGAGQTRPERPGAVRADWVTMGPFGGDVWAVAQSPTAANVALAGLAPTGSFGGAMYRSTDGGATWTIVPTLANNSVFDIEFAPDGTAYAGTMDGVWRSVDAGATWTNLPLGIGLNDQTFDVAIDPSNPQVLWAGIADAIGSNTNLLMYSNNGGTTWTPRTPAGAAVMSVRAIAINPNNPQEMAIAQAGAFGGGAVWVSTNGGTAWNNRSAGLPANPLTTIVHDGTRFLIGGGQLFGSQFVGLYSSSNQGQTWDQLHTASWPSRVINKIAVDPTNAATIYLATTAGIFKSTTGGTDWSFGVGNTAGIAALTVRNAPASANTVFLGGNSVGVYKSTNAGAQFNASTTGIIALDVYSVHANPLNPSEMAIAFQGQNNGGVYRSTDGGQTWTLESAPPTRYNVVRFAPDGTLYAISDGPTGIAQEALYRRNPNGTWTNIGPNQGSLFESELFTVRFSVNNPQLILAGGGDFGVAGAEGTIWRSPDAGQTWTKVHESVEPSKPITDIEIIEDGTDQIAVASFLDFTGGQVGGVLRSTNNGQNWSPSSTGLPATLMPRSLANVVGAPGTLLLGNDIFSAGPGLFRSVDGGQNWTATGFNSGVKLMDTDKSNPQIVYIARAGTGGTQDRVHRSTDGGTTFSLFSDGLLAQNGFAQDLVATTGSTPRLLLATTKSSFRLELGGGGCYANCDGSTTAPTLNVADFTCFLQRFAAGDSYANCDGSTTAPVLNVADFTCFLQSFAVGCP